ncbi:unnamed protein product [Moneuplotes crassus]|uniref:Uncharacterized protein n=1 Tax=Euplotes crassus TaxID=5936 RepID=A0AAD2D4D6_EUPCR|nr:unnamed protein product [Moneuplotes crassus]
MELKLGDDDDNNDEVFTVDNIFTLGAMPIYIEEFNAPKQIKVEEPKKGPPKKKDSDESVDKPKKKTLNELMEEGKKEISRLRQIDKKLLYPDTDDLNEVLMNAIKEMQEQKDKDFDEEDKDKDKISDTNSEASQVHNNNILSANKVIKPKDKRKKSKKSRPNYFSKNDKLYQEEVAEVERINKALCNNDIHLDMKVIRRAVLMYMNDA